MLEEVEVETLVVLCLFGERNEEADEEDDDDEQQEGNGVLERAQDALADSLLAVLGGIIVVLLVVEVGEGNDQQAEDGVERVQQVVDNLQGVGDVVDLLGRGPVLLAAQRRAGGGRDEGDVDGDEQDSGQQGQGREDAHDGDRGGALAGRLVDEDEDGRYGEQERDGDGVGDPDEGRLDERHLREMGRRANASWVPLRSR